MLQLKRSCQNLVVVGLIFEDRRGVQSARVAGVAHDDPQETIRLVFQGNPILKGVFLAQAIDDADALPGFEILGVVPHLEGVQLLEHRAGTGHEVVLEILECIVVVQQDRGVDDEHLGADLARGFLGRIALGLSCFRSVGGVPLRGQVWFNEGALGRQARSVCGASIPTGVGEEAPGGVSVIPLKTPSIYSPSLRSLQGLFWTSSRHGRGSPERPVERAFQQRIWMEGRDRLSLPPPSLQMARSTGRTCLRAGRGESSAVRDPLREGPSRSSGTGPLFLPGPI